MDESAGEATHYSLKKCIDSVAALRQRYGKVFQSILFAKPCNSVTLRLRHRLFQNEEAPTERNFVLSDWLACKTTVSFRV